MTSSIDQDQGLGGNNRALPSARSGALRVEPASPSQAEPPAANADRGWMIDLQHRLDLLREAADDYIIISLGVRGSNVDCPEGNAIATVRMGNDSETYEALYLPDAITGARNAILRKRRLEAERREKEKGK